ncbi:MAG: pyridine nucleotide-disulfide oxidoreductase, partial [Desulfobacterales bacterium]|nr:pyridine nucleotide-disulfide oxidoreductase [Desulfobacterales bacterium]
LTNRSTFKVNHQTLQTSVPDVFAAGDAVTGPATVIEAVAAGHKAVAAMDCYLNGEDLEQFADQQAEAESAPGDDWQPLDKEIEEVPRVVAAHRDPEQRSRNFDEVDLSFDDAAARQEAARCVDCGGCCECRLCETACEAKAVNHAMEDQVAEIEVGSIIVATGFDPLDPAPMQQYGYGRYAN